MQACPAESTKRSRSGHAGSAGLVRSRRVKSVCPSGASAIAVPGCPALAFCTASIASPRMVSIASAPTSRSVCYRATSTWWLILARWVATRFA